MLEVVDFIRQNGLAQLTQDYAIKVKRHGVYNNLVLLKYNQINSPMSERVVQESRGLILDENADWKVVAFPYLKFFNWGEGHAAEIDWNTARVQEKLDGSLMTVFFYDNKWHVSTSGTPDALSAINNVYGTSFSDFFWQTWKELGYSLPKDEKCNYVFELMSRDNRVVVVHDKARIVLHGVRNLETLQEVHPDAVAEENGWECVQSYPMSTIEEVVEAAKDLEGIKAEGFIVCDANFNRLKVKGADYVALHHMIDGFSPKRMLEKVILKNEGEEFLTYFPEYKEDYFDIKNRFNNIVKGAEQFYETVKHIENQKEFALAVVPSEYSGACFAVRGGKKDSFDTYYRNLLIPNLMKLLGLKDVEETVEEA